MVRETDPPLQPAAADGMVTISGVVLTRIMHERVLYAAASTPGVKKVSDELYTDPEIANAVAAALAADPKLNGAAVDVSSYKGSIAVYGHMPNAAQREKALTIAAAVPGVRNVIDRLEAAPQES